MYFFNNNYQEWILPYLQIRNFFFDTETPWVLTLCWNLITKDWQLIDIKLSIKNWKYTVKKLKWECDIIFYIPKYKIENWEFVLNNTFKDILKKEKKEKILYSYWIFLNNYNYNDYKHFYKTILNW